MRLFCTAFLFSAVLALPAEAQLNPYLLRKIRSGKIGSQPSNVKLVNQVQFFTADNGVAGRELWKSAPPYNSLTTGMVKDINPGPGSAGTMFILAHNIGPTLFFPADNGTAGLELWKSAPPYNSASTVMVADINPGAGSSRPLFMTAIGATLFFTADNGVAGRELWKSAPPYNSASTVMVADINPGAGNALVLGLFTSVGATLFFGADNGTVGRELWKSEPPYTSATTSMVADIRPGSAASKPFFGRQRAVIGTTLLFTADNGTVGRELWKSDPPYTAATTVLVRDIRPGAASSNPANFSVIQNTLFFRAGTDFQRGGGVTLWKSTPPFTAATTAMVSTSARRPRNPAVIGDTLFFVAESADNPRDAHIFKTSPPYTGVGQATNTRQSGMVVYGANHLTAVRDTLFFVAQDPPYQPQRYGIEPWILKPPYTPADAALLKDVNGGDKSSSPNGFFAGYLTTEVFFAAKNDDIGVESWVTPFPSSLKGGGAMTWPIGVGCFGSAGLPETLPVGLPKLGTSFGIQLFNARANSSAILAISAKGGDLVLPGGCTFYLGLPVPVALGAVTSGAGRVLKSLPIPASPPLVGGSVYFQWAIADPKGAYWNQLAFTNGLLAIVGKR